MLSKICRFAICIDSTNRTSMEKILDENSVQVLDIDDQHLFQRVTFYCEANLLYIAGLEKDCREASFEILMRNS